MIINEFFKRFISSLVIIPIISFVIFIGSYLFEFFLLIVFLICFNEWKNLSKNKIFFFCGLILLIISFACAYYLRKESIYLFSTIILICIFTDIGGYIFGKIFKGPKLTKISPNKTYSGLIGGLFLPLLIYIYLAHFSKDFIILKSGSILNFENFIIVIFLSLISQAGDITVSFFKRLAKVKNTGNLLPGHGGVLDRIDGMLFAIPFYFLIIYLIN